MVTTRTHSTRYSNSPCLDPSNTCILFNSDPLLKVRLARAQRTTPLAAPAPEAPVSHPRTPLLPTPSNKPLLQATNPNYRKKGACFLTLILCLGGELPPPVPELNVVPLDVYTSLLSHTFSHGVRGIPIHTRLPRVHSYLSVCDGCIFAQHALSLVCMFRCGAASANWGVCCLRCCPTTRMRPPLHYWSKSCCCAVCTTCGRPPTSTPANCSPPTQRNWSVEAD